MDDTNETIADISAELRHNSRGLMFYFRNEENGSTHAMGVDYIKLADRLDAALKRERGDRAKLREALSDACYAMFNFLKTRSGGYEEMANAIDKAKAALADTSNQNTQEEN